MCQDVYSLFYRSHDHSVAVIHAVQTNIINKTIKTKVLFFKKSNSILEQFPFD